MRHPDRAVRGIRGEAGDEQRGMTTTAAPNDAWRWAALGLFVVIAATDALDGWLARSRGEVTRLGRLLDPLADKGLLVSAIIVLTLGEKRGLEPSIPVWYTTVVISRDVFLLLGAGVIHHYRHKVVVIPRVSGKATTFFQMAIVVWILAGLPEAGFLPLVLAGGGLTIFSWIQYLFDGMHQLEQHLEEG